MTQSARFARPPARPRNRAGVSDAPSLCLSRLIDHGNAAPRQLAGDLPCLHAAQVLHDVDLLAHPLRAVREAVLAALTP
ncbi:MAG: hypothetical protein ACK41U_01905 [Paracoccus sp. (in: a-proteobacteria)]|uniref:hypothetical protein n=1 Tax=Paracoccus sp. TaxID=267 RepID=UPI00391B007A